MGLGEQEIKNIYFSFIISYGFEFMRNFRECLLF